MTSERARRIGLNEAAFRRVNEELEGLAARFQVDDRLLDLVCECGNVDCDQRIRMSRPEYEEVRADPALFAVVSGHEIPDVETVVSRRAEYVVVRKRPGEPERIAEATDTGRRS
jgi:hypothetical protein